MIKEELKKLIDDSLTALSQEKKLREFYVGKLSPEMILEDKNLPESLAWIAKSEPERIRKGEVTGYVVHLIELEHPKDFQYGDYSTNIALHIAKEQQKNPREVAELIVGKLNSKDSKFIERVEIAGPGFINFFLSEEYFSQELRDILKQKERYGECHALKDEKIIVEFTDPNLFKEFHIGHLYSNIVGETICKILEVNGAKVKRANYQGDVGMHVAKAVWGMKKLMAPGQLYFTNLEKKPLKERLEFLGRSYAQGERVFQGNTQAKKEMAELNKKIFGKDPSVKTFYEKGRKWSLDYFETVYKRLGTKFNFYYFESDVGKKGQKIVQEGLKKGIFEKSEGAVIFPGEKHGLHSRVFINSQGLPTYEAKELGLAFQKFKDFRFDRSITITGNDIIDYFKVLIAVLKLINPEIGNKIMHIAHGMVRLPEGKMSSRTGNVVTGEELLEEVKIRAKKLMDSSAIGKELSKDEQEGVAEAVGLGAVKYSLLRVGLGKDIVFDFEKSLSLQGDSGPYIQYTYARCQSIAHKAGISNFKFLISKPFLNSNISNEEMAILRALYKFPEVVREAAEKFAPNLLCNFVFELAQAYNLFYNTHQVLKAETKEQRESRLLLTAATAQVLKNALSLLGIKTPERM